jgi:hypothetical protein
MSELKNCPFCGEKPKVCIEGSCIDIECCASMSFQKIDLFESREKRHKAHETYNLGTHRYSDEIEEWLLNEVVKMWNIRIEDICTPALNSRDPKVELPKMYTKIEQLLFQLEHPSGQWLVGFYDCNGFFQTLPHGGVYRPEQVKRYMSIAELLKTIGGE